MLSLQQFSYYRSGFPTPALVPVGFLLICALVSHESLYSPVSPILGAVLCPVLPSLMTLRSVNFSVCSAFYLLLEWSGNLQPHCVMDLKPEYSLLILTQKTDELVSEGSYRGMNTKANPSQYFQLT